jgi:S1-C subfamily serine protease
VATSGEETAVSNNIPVAAPIDTDSAGKGGDIAQVSVVRVICPKDNSSGTGFLHKSGHIITAHHVIAGCSDILLVDSKAVQTKASLLAGNQDLDLAILSTETPIKEKALPISARDGKQLAVGTQVSTWGFPGGYLGLVPILSVGYLSGQQAFKTKSGRIVKQWIVNAAFNRGNSGGPRPAYRNW